jgi:site-specific DNA recombinase
MWMGGVISLGYRVENRKLIIDEAEAETVGHLFDRYLELGQRTCRASGSDRPPRQDDERSLCPKTIRARQPLSPALEPTLHRQDQASRSEGEHLPLIDARIFAKAQKLLADGAPTRSLPPNREHRHLLHWHRLR